MLAYLLIANTQTRTQLKKMVELEWGIKINPSSSIIRAHRSLGFVLLGCDGHGSPREEAAEKDTRNIKGAGLPGREKRTSTCELGKG